MAVFQSNQVANQLAIPPIYDEALNYYGKLRILRFNYTTAVLGTIADSVRLVRLPAGKVSVIGPLSRIRNSAGGASLTGSIGNEAYKDKNGNTVVAAVANLASALAWTAAASNELLPTFPADGITTFESLGGVIITATTAALQPPAGFQLNGFFVIAVE